MDNPSVHCLLLDGPCSLPILMQCIEIYLCLNDLPVIWGMLKGQSILAYGQSIVQFRITPVDFKPWWGELSRPSHSL